MSCDIRSLLIDSPPPALRKRLAVETSKEEESDDRPIEKPAKIKKSRREEELERVKRRVDGFNYHKSRAWAYLVQRYGERITQEELISIAEVLYPYSGVKLDRDARRRKNVIIKWYDDNWNKIEQFLKYVILEEPSVSHRPTI